MAGGMRRDVEKHLAARQAGGLAAREGEGDGLVYRFGREGIDIVGIPVPSRTGVARYRFEGWELDRARRRMVVRACLEMVAEDLVDDLDVVEQPAHQDPLLVRQPVEA